MVTIGFDGAGVLDGGGAANGDSSEGVGEGETSGGRLEPACWVAEAPAANPPNPSTIAVASTARPRRMADERCSQRSRSAIRSDERCLGMPRSIGRFAMPSLSGG